MTDKNPDPVFDRAIRLVAAALVGILVGLLIVVLAGAALRLFGVTV